jgi:predicted RNA-binding Zn-ribbon protein involved in translation (DUF1610 family)
VDEKEDLFRCPYCNGRNTIWIGYRHNISGKKRIRRCKNCRKKFTPRDIFSRARFYKSHVIEAVALHHGGLSLDRVKTHLLQHRNTSVSRTSILKWSRKYSSIVDELALKLKSVIRGVEHCEDVYFEIVGDEVYCSGVMDSKVIFKISSRLSLDSFKDY